LDQVRRCSSLPFSIIVALLFARAELFAQQQEIAASPPEPVAKVSFELFHNRVYLPVEVNGHGPFELVLDTGAASSGVNEAIAQSIGLQDTGKAQLAGNGESRIKIAVAKDVVFRVGAAEVQEKTVAIVPLRQLESHEGRAIAGVLGVDLFHRFIVLIDYSDKTLALYEPQGFTYHGTGEVVPLHIKSTALLEATIEIEGRGPIECKLAVDSGTYSALRLYRPFVQKHHIVGPETPSIDSFGFGIGGEFPEKLGRVEALRIGAIALEEPTASFSDAKTGATSTAAYDGTIGGAILSRFTIIFDYPHHQMILQPNQNLSKPFPSDTSGLILGIASLEQKAITVFHVLDRTPAAEASIKEGDIVLSVNGTDAYSLGVDGVRSLFVNPGVYRIQVGRDMQVLDLVMKTTKPLY
jgi:Aspartyl protease/PDZ domain